MTGQYTFIVVGKKDNPLYEYCSSTKATNRSLLATACQRATSHAVLAQKEESSHFNQFIVHAALDIVETDPVRIDLSVCHLASTNIQVCTQERGSWSTQNMYLKVVDKFNDQLISAFVTAGQVRSRCADRARVRALSERCPLAGQIHALARWAERRIHPGIFH